MSLQLRQRVILIVLFMICYSYVLPRWSDWSQNSRLDLVLALADDGAVSIDRYIANTGDYALYNGHAYSDKAPGVALIALPVYIALRPVLNHPSLRSHLQSLASSGALASTLRAEGTGLNEEKVRFALVQYALTILSITVAAALFSVVFYGALRHIQIDSAPALLGVLAYGLGTTAVPYAGNLYSHQLVAVLLFGAFSLAWRCSPATTNWWSRSLLCGLLLGWAVISEYPAALPALAIGIYSLYRQRWRWMIPMIIGAMPPMLLMIIHNLVAFDTPWPVGYAHSAFWGSQLRSGFMSVTYPHLIALWGLTFGGFRGLFVRAPWLLLAVPGYIAWWKSSHWRAELWVALVVPLSLFLFYSSSEALWWGGFAAGPRYLVATLPFLALPAAWWIGQYWRQRAARLLAVALVSLSAAATWAEALAGQLFPDEQIKATWSKYVLPAWERGDIARNLGSALGLHGAASLLPLLAAATLLIVLLFRQTNRQANSEQMAASSIIVQSS